MGIFHPLLDKVEQNVHRANPVPPAIYQHIYIPTFIFSLVFFPLLEKVEQNIQDNPSASGNLLTNANTFIFHRLFSLLVSYTREKMYIQGIPIASEIGAFLRNDP